MKSKRFPLSLLLIFGASLHSVGQIAIGAKAGYNFNSFRANKEYDVVPGFTVGGVAKYPVFDFLTARGELLYVQQAANIEDYYVLPGELYHSGSRVTFHTIQIPLIAEFGLPSLSEEAIQPKLLLGGFYSYNIKARESYESVLTVTGYEQQRFESHSNLTSNFKRHQYGIVGALAAEIEAFGFPVSLEFRYQMNLNPISVDGSQNFYNLSATHERWGNKLYLSTLSFNVAVRLIYL